MLAKTNTSPALMGLKAILSKVSLGLSGGAKIDFAAVSADRGLELSWVNLKAAVFRGWFYSSGLHGSTF